MSGHVYKLLELTGSSTVDIEDAIRNAIAKANESVRHIHWFEVTEIRGTFDESSVGWYQVTMKVGFRLDDPEA